MTVYDLTKKLIEKSGEEVIVEPEKDSSLDRLLTWAEGMGYEAYSGRTKEKKKAEKVAWK